MRINTNIKPLILTFLLLCPAFAAAQQTAITAGATLTLEQCIDITLKNSPKITTAKAAEQAQYSKLWQTRAGYMPQVNASASYSRSDQEGATGFTGADDSYSSSINATQLIYDFGQTGLSNSIQKNSYLSAKEDLRNTENNVIYSLKQAYYGVLSAKAKRDVYQQSVEQYQEQLKRAQAFFDVGTKPKIDVTTAQVNLNNAKLNLITGQNSLEVAYHTLLNVMGLYDATTDFTLQENDTIPDFSITAQDAFEQALAARPDLEAYRLKAESAKQNVKLSATGFAPELNATASYGWSGKDYPLYDKWSVGAGLSLPIFSGFSTYNKVQESKSNLQSALAALNSAQQDIKLEVNTAYLNFIEAQSKIPVADLSRQQAQESYNLAVGRYTVGVGNYIEVKDSEVTLSNAKLAYINAVLDYNLAIANLKKVMGTK